MKKLDIKTTTLELRKLTGKVSDEGKMSDTCDLIEVTLDSIPQGGFTPKDIRDRNRIQVSVDKFREERSKAKDSDKTPKSVLTLEDADYENLKTTVNSSRWASREKPLQEFLDTFNKD